MFFRDYFNNKIGNQTYTNQNGNITQYQDKEFKYDYLNRLTELKQNGTTIASYTYDASNRRVSKTLNTSNSTTTYIYNNNQVIQEYVNDSLTNSYIYASYIDDPIAYTYNSNTYYYIKDRQYSIQAIANSFGDIVESYSYTAFGKLTIKDSLGNIIDNTSYNNSFTYTGRRYDSESGLYHYRNRMYSAELGRFLQRDPKGYVDGMNLYAYVMNNPLKYLDAMGTTSLLNIQNGTSSIKIGNVKMQSNVGSNIIDTEIHGLKVEQVGTDYSISATGASATAKLEGSLKDATLKMGGGLTAIETKVEKQFNFNLPFSDKSFTIKVGFSGGIGAAAEIGIVQPSLNSGQAKFKGGIGAVWGVDVQWNIK